jgi:hypothetical protein
MTQFSGGAEPLSEQGLAAALDSSGFAPAELWCVLAVETTGCGYLPDRRPKILFERHIFSRLTDHRFDAEDPDVSQATSGGYGPSGAHQYDRLAAAMQLDSAAALQSASWGLGQILGTNFRAAGFGSIDSLVSDMITSEDAQLRAMVSFMNAHDLTKILKNHDWAAFARLYNGPDYAANNYDGLLAHFFQHFSRALPDLQIRTAQMYLYYLEYPVGAIDGVMGRATRDAVRAFQVNANLPPTPEVDQRLVVALQEKLAEKTTRRL